MKYRYRLFDLVLQFNVEVPGLVVCSDNVASDVEVTLDPTAIWHPEVDHFQATLHYRDAIESGLHVWQLDGYGYRFVYPDCTEFIISNNGSRIWAGWPPELTYEDTLTYLLGPVIGFVLRLRNQVCLHASAFVLDNKAIALCGMSGRGKSTTAAAFARSGYPLLTDDIVALTRIEDQFYVQPAYPRLRLWPESAEILFGSRTALPPLTPSWNKLYLDLSQDEFHFQDTALPLVAVFILGERSHQSSAPFMESISHSDALVQLVSNTYSNYLLDKEMRLHEFEQLSHLVQNISIRRVIPHTSPSRIEDLCDTILQDFRALAP